MATWPLQFRPLHVIYREAVLHLINPVIWTQTSIGKLCVGGEASRLAWCAGLVSAADSDLRNAGVGRDDVFYFGDYFEHASAGQPAGAMIASDGTLLFGWSKVGDILYLGPDGLMPLDSTRGRSEIPHVGPGWKESNAIFLVTKSSQSAMGQSQALGSSSVRSRSLRRRRQRLRRGPSRLGWIPTRGGAGMTYNPPNPWLGNGR